MNVKLLCAALTAVVLAVAAAACTVPPDTAPQPAPPAPVPMIYSESVDGYLAAAPAVLRAGRTANVSVSLFDGSEPARGDVRVALLREGSPVAEAGASVAGAGVIPLPVPALPAGYRAIDYTLRIEGGDADGSAFTDTAPVLVTEPAELLFLETDKPIYKPGQQIRIRALRLDSDLKPLPGPVEVSILDAKGIKVYKATVAADEFGMAEADLPLSTEPNLGVWKITAASEEQETQLDVRVEEYVLPKYEISVDLPKAWTLVDEPIAGAVSAEYSFGRPVRGELEIVASRYVGTWEEYARFGGEIDGAASFELPPAGYVAGVPGAGGQGNVQLEITVREPATGYEERVTKLLTVAERPVNLQLIPESGVFKPGLPLSLLVVSETPDQLPVAADVTVSVHYVDGEFETVSEESHDLAIDGSGGALLELVPPSEAVALTVTAQSPDADATLAMLAGHSPSGNFIHVAQTGDAALSVGALATFRVNSTAEARQFYYEVVGRSGVIFSDIAWTPDIAFEVTPAMAPTARLLVYQILPDNEVAADYIPFSASAGYPMPLEVKFSSDEVRPGDAVDISVQTTGPAKVGLAAVDRSVFILAENRLNLQQVFAELERLYAQPQAEIHFDYLPDRVETRGAAETFRSAGLLTISDQALPAGSEFHRPRPERSRGGDWQLTAVLVFMGFLIVAFVLGMIGLIVFGIIKFARAVFTSLFLVVIAAATGGLVACGGYEEAPAPAAPQAASAPAAVEAPSDDGLAEVERVRQFFPETWLWADVMTDAEGNATLPATAPDSITTWNLRAVGVSPEHGLGIGNAELTVFQPFFLQVDLPYSAIRGEEFPVKAALYNYLDTPQEFFVELEESTDFALLDDPAQSVTVAPNEVGGVEFNIRLTELGSRPIKVTARSREAADAVIRNLLVEPEGVAREIVDNAILAPGDRLDFDLAAPPGAIPGSNRAYAALTGSYLAQTLDGLENLLQMPYGCGEQNMILFAPNIYVARYLDATDQVKPEIMAKAEHLMTTGYQRQLTYRRSDGSFSAFGQSDAEGSLWLTAFVLKSFAQADGLIYIDETVLRDAADWILSHRRSDGSFEPVGFLHHQELLGGLRGNTALTAYVAIALHEAGYDRDTAMSVAYLESRLDDIDDAYTMAIVAYALELAGSPRAGDASRALLDMATADGDGLRWDGPASVETTGYALLALLERGDAIIAGNAARWLAAQRNASGGFGSTQDTVVGLQALIGYAAGARFDVDMTVDLAAGDWSKQVAINADNADVVQIVELPDGADLQITAAGSGRVVAQVVQRFNMPEVERPAVEMFQIDVEYSADHVAVDDLIEITARFAFTPPESPGPAPDAGMVVLDVAVPTGFAPVTETVARLVADYARVKRYEIAGRKVILYLEDLSPGEELELRFDARAQYPVRARAVTSQAYSYYTPQWRGETLGGSVTVSGN